MLQAGQIIVHTGRPFEAVQKVLKKVARERDGEVLQVVQIIAMGLTSKCKMLIYSTTTAAATTATTTADAAAATGAVHLERCTRVQ